MQWSKPQGQTRAKEPARLPYERGKKEEKPHKVWRIAVEGGDPQEIRLPMERLGYVGDVSFHPDGRRIAFISRHNKSEVWMMDNFLPAAQTKKTTVSRR